MYIQLQLSAWSKFLNKINVHYKYYFSVEAKHFS